MNSILSAFTAIANLARALNRLTAVVDAVAAEAEQRVEVVGHQPASPVPLLPADRETVLNGSAEPARRRR